MQCQQQGDLTVLSALWPVLWGGELHELCLSVCSEGTEMNLSLTPCASQQRKIKVWNKVCFEAKNFGQTVTLKRDLGSTIISEVHQKAKCLYGKGQI